MSNCGLLRFATPNVFTCISENMYLKMHTQTAKSQNKGYRNSNDKTLLRIIKIMLDFFACEDTIILTLFSVSARLIHITAHI